MPTYGINEESLLILWLSNNTWIAGCASDRSGRDGADSDAH